MKPQFLEGTQVFTEKNIKWSEDSLEDFKNRRSINSTAGYDS